MPPKDRHWGKWILDHFFPEDGSWAGRPVVLGVHGEVLQQAWVGLVRDGQPLDHDQCAQMLLNSLLEEVDEPEQFFQRMGTVTKYAWDDLRRNDLRTDWLYRTAAFLAFLVYTEAERGDSRSYWGAFKERVGARWLPNDAIQEAIPQAFDVLWEWSRKHNWERGRFYSGQIGELVYVGRIRAQALIDEESCRWLEYGFKGEGLPLPEEVDTIDESELLAAVRRVVRNLPRAVQRALGGNDKDLLKAFVGVVRSYWDAWDGSGYPPRETEEDQFGRTRASVHLALGILDPATRHVRATFRCFAAQFPESLALEVGSQSATFTESDYEFRRNTRWSNALAVDDADLDATRIDWLEGFEVSDDIGRWTAAWRGREVRVMDQPAAMNYGGRGVWLLESREFDGRRACHLLVHEGKLAEVGKYFQQFERLEVRAGLPTGWGLYAVSDCTNADDFCKRFGFRSASGREQACIRYVDAPRVQGNASNQFFSFALPRVVLDPPVGEEATLLLSWNCGEMPRSAEVIVPASGDSVDLPCELKDPPAGHVTLNPNGAGTGPLQLTSRFEIVESPAAVTRAVAAHRHESWQARVTAKAIDHVGLMLSPPKVWLLGGVPGLVAIWEKGGQELGFDPIWAVIEEDAGTRAVFFIGEQGEAVNPSPASAPVHPGDERVQAWRDIVKGATVLEHQELWDRHLAAAGDGEEQE